MKYIYIIVSAFVSIVLFHSCEKDHEIGPGEPNADNETMMALTMKPDGDWTALSFDSEAVTRAPGTSAVDESNVNDVWVFQFDGLTDNSKLISPQRYTTDVAEPMAFVNRGTSVQRIVVVANTNAPDHQWVLVAGTSTYADFKAKVRTIDKEADMYPANRLIMIGIMEIATNGTAGFNQTVQMKRLAARLRMTLSCTQANIIIDSVQMCNLPTTYGVTGTDAAIAAPCPAIGSTGHLNYAALSDRAYLPASNGVAKMFTYYVPENRQGSVSNTNPKWKNNLAPKEATFIRIYAHDASVPGLELRYIVYPGGNMYNDFNLESNASYNLTLVIQGRDDVLVDSRIESDGDIISFAGKAANSYILNPASTGARKYRIYPTHVDKFWGSEYENVPKNLLGIDAPWTVDLLWMDKKNLVQASGIANITLSKTQGAGVNDYFEITVPAAALHGNFLLYLYKTGDAAKAPLWSWHFWVTDYAPDISKAAAAQGQFIYSTNKGGLHRYKGAIWETGMYKKNFIMDRDLGDESSYPNNKGTAGTGVLQYQFGRKDPFPNNATVYLMNNTAAKSVAALAQKGGTGSGVGMAESVLNPGVFYTGSSGYTWTDVYETSSNFYLWHDKKYSASTLAAIQAMTAKSLYDPCPYGWRLPNKGTWSDFVYNETAINPNRSGLELTLNGKTGVRYWPKISIDGNYPVGGSIYYAYAYYRSYSTAGMASNGTFGRWWTSTPGSVYYGCHLSAYDNSISESTSFRGSGFSVRCVSNN